MLVESVCHGGGFASTIVASVQVVALHDPAKTKDLLGVDTGGSEAQRPRLHWTGPASLQVTVQNLSFLRIQTLDFGPIRVDLRFDPPDPAAREAWLRSLDAADRGE